VQATVKGQEAVMMWTVLLACSGDPSAADGDIAPTADTGHTAHTGHTADTEHTADTAASVEDCTEAVGAPLVDLHTGDVAETYGAMYADGADLIAVFESATPDFAASSLRLARSTDGGTSWSMSEPLDGPDLPFVGGPTLAVIDGTPWVYTVGGDTIWGEAQVHRTDPGSGEVQAVELPGTESVLDWPYVQADDAGAVWLATIEQGRRVVARSEDGMDFDVTGDLGPNLPQFSVHPFADGTLAAVWQTGVDPQQVYVQLSDDGAVWGEALLASEASGNVHDGRFVRRADGDLDLYYIAALPDVNGFSVFRRYVGPDGHLGPEERLTSPEEGNVNKPSPHRLGPCRVGLTVSRVVDPDPRWWVAHAASLVLVGDADPGR